MSLPPDSWRIVDAADGWTLRWRPPLTGCFPGIPAFVRFLPSWLFTRWGGLAWALAVLIFGFLIEQFGGPGGSSPARPIGIGVVVSCVLFLFQTYAFVEHGFNAEQSATFRAGCLQTSTGVFPAECLESLRLEETRVRPGRAVLTFEGTRLARAELVGSPGLSPEVAQELLDAIRSRTARP